MRVVVVNPPIKSHLARGTGVYMRNLTHALKNFTQVQIILADVSNLRQNVDLIHFPYFDPFFRTLPIQSLKPTVVTIHDLIPLLYPEHFPKGVKGALHWYIQRLIIRGVEAVITDSHASQKDIEKIIGLPKDKIHIVYLAPGEEYLKRKTPTEKKQVRQKYSLPESFALFVGDVNWNKNLINTIYATTLASVQLVVVSRAFAEVDPVYHPWKKSLIESQSAARNNPYIHKIGYVDKGDLPTIYQLATVLVAPSHYEGFGLPVVEAFASGCPVITSGKGALAEVADDAALTVQPTQIGEIANALQKVFRDKNLRQKLIQLGYDQVKMFSWSMTAQKISEIYRHVLKESDQQ